MVLALLATPFLSLALIAGLFPRYPPEELGYSAFIFTVFAVMACGIGSQVYRFRFVSGPTERQQTKWVLFGLGAQLIWIGWWIVSIALVLNIDNDALWALVTLHINALIPLLIPLTFGLAVLRYRLWDIDPLINRTLVYGALTGIIILLYVLIVGALGLLFQARGSLLVSLLATGAIAVAFQPLRQRLQQDVDKIMYGQRNDPIGMLTRLTRQLETTGDAENPLPGLVETVAIALKFPYVAVELPGENSQAWVSAASTGEGQAHVEQIALRHKNQEIGRLVVAPRSPGEQLAEADRLLLANIAQLLATTVQTLQLNAQLRQSRRQLVTAREEERRRIRRDLHDGLGPVLASLTIQADTTADLVHSDPDQAVTVLKKMRDKTQAAVTDIRHLVRGLRPPTLDELGLAGAIRQYIANLEPNELVFNVDAPETLPALPAAVEVAAYRIAQEAVVNVTRHARSTTCTVRVVVDDVLYLQVIDDGIGLSEGRPTGMGLKSMRERAAELGGTCITESLPAGGTRVVARLPLNGLAE
jgi:signal transduction histidine kinase